MKKSLVLLICFISAFDMQQEVQQENASNNDLITRINAAYNATNNTREKEDLEMLKENVRNTNHSLGQHYKVLDNIIKLYK